MDIKALERELTDLAASDAFSGVVRIEIAVADNPYLGDGL